MSLNIRPSTSGEREQIFIETLLSTTQKLTKIVGGSVLDGVAKGVAKISGKPGMDIIKAIGQLFPDLAFNEVLDACAENFGIAPRFGALGSSTYVRLTADPGTTYLASTHIPSSTTGLTFTLANDITIGASGFAYVLVNSANTGANTNVDPLTISKISPQPFGHKNIVNEFMATGGQDIEMDELFRVRIRDGANILARQTPAMLEQVFKAQNEKVFRVEKHAGEINGQGVTAISTVNGSTLSETELSELLNGSVDFLALNEQPPYGKNCIGRRLVNAPFMDIDIVFRVKLFDNADPDLVREIMQQRVFNYIDYRKWDAVENNSYQRKIEWERIYNLMRTVDGVENMPDRYFFPRMDAAVQRGYQPRVRLFLMTDLQGRLISNFSNTFSPVYYPATIDENYVKALLPYAGLTNFNKVRVFE